MSTRTRPSLVMLLLGLLFTYLAVGILTAQADCDSPASSGASTAVSPEPCWPSDTPLGALPPAIPIWCTKPTSGPSTYTEGSNSWLDEFGHGLSNADMGEGYEVFESEGSILRSQHFRHNNHWMVDVAGHGRNPDEGPPWNLGGATMRPERSFRFVNGKLVVEVDMAAGIDEYAGNAWPEIVVTTAPAPTGQVVDNLYSYGIFGGHWTVGIRLQSSRVPIAALYDNTGRGVGDGGRVFEIAFWLDGGAQEVFGGGPFGELDAAWRVCQGTDPDKNCRDRFRWELTRDTLALYVNGVRYMEHRGLPPESQLPDALLKGEVYVYFSSWIYRPEADTVRFHWEQIAINPEESIP